MNCLTLYTARTTFDAKRICKDDFDASKPLNSSPGTVHQEVSVTVNLSRIPSGKVSV